jgi:hypothetical protein
VNLKLILLVDSPILRVAQNEAACRGSPTRRVIFISCDGMNILLWRHVRSGNTESSLIAPFHLVRE